MPGGREAMSWVVWVSEMVEEYTCWPRRSVIAFIMPSSSMPAASLTVWDSVSSHLTLGIMFWATLVFMPLIVLYTSWAYRVMRGKVTLEQIRANEHTAY